MKGSPLYAVCCLVVLSLLLAGCRKNGTRQIPRMAPPYMYRDKNPMGTNMAYRLLPQQFTGTIYLASKKINNQINVLSYVKGTSYISIGKDIKLSDEELEEVLAYVDRGNEFFLASEDIDYRLLDTLGIKEGTDTIAASEAVEVSPTYVQIADTNRYGTTKYGFFYYPLNGVFTSYDTSRTTVLGLDEHRRPNYIVVRYGKGKFYFHREPSVFSNYFLLTAHNTAYYSEVFSYLNKDAHTVFWGDIYRFRKDDGFSALSIFWNNRLLTYALLISCGLMLLYIAFGSKRKRRLIPARAANTNASLSFVRTIGNLYLQKKDNRNIAVKKITYFLEFVRNNYHLNTSNLNTEFIQALSRKSGVPEQRVQLLVQHTDNVNNTESLTDQELFEINNLIDEFYKR